MTIKSLLMGSAAALLGLNAAQAADAIVVPEPEPVDYVRVCDVYGAGFFYLPGTETCLQLSGYVRLDTVAAGDPAVNLEGDDYEVSTTVRTRLNFDVREETELGLLRAYFRLQSDNVSGLDSNFQMDQAYLQLGGLLIGYRDSLWSSDVGGIEDGLLTDTDLVVGDFNTNQLSYTVAANGFSATLGIEDDGTGDAVPDIHAKLVYENAGFGAYLSAVYDETFNEEDVISAIGGDAFQFQGVDVYALDLPNIPAIINNGSNDAFALKGGIQLSNLIAPESTLKIEGHYAFDPTVYSVIDGLATTRSLASGSNSIQDPVQGSVPIFLEWAAGAGYAQSFGKLGLAVSGQYGRTFDTQFFGVLPSGNNGFINSRGDYYALVGNAGYKFTTNFSTLAEVAYRNVDFDGIGDTDQVTGFLRFQRDF